MPAVLVFFGEGLQALADFGLDGLTFTHHLICGEDLGTGLYSPDPDDSVGDSPNALSQELDADDPSMFPGYSPITTCVSRELDTDNNRLLLDFHLCDSPPATQDFTWAGLGAGLDAEDQRPVQGSMIVASDGSNFYLFAYYGYAEERTTSGCDFTVPTFGLPSETEDAECGDLGLPYGEATGTCTPPE